MTPAQPHDRSAASGQAVRRLGRFQLLRLLGKTRRSMQWLVADERGGQGTELVLVMPRQQPADGEALARWLAAAQRAARIAHPGLAQPVEVGEQEHWPFIAYDRERSVLLSERIGSRGLAPSELVPAAVQALEGLAFAHEAGIVHHDLHSGMLMLADGGGGRLMGLGVVQSDNGSGLQARRQEAERDVLAMGLVLHHALAGQPALEQADVMEAVALMPPLGREIVRLPWLETHSIPEPLRAIVNRATDRQERQRYRNARTLERALSGWLRTHGDGDAGPLALLLDRMRSAGLLPAMPGGMRRAAKLAGMEQRHVSEMADIVLEDIGLSFELLRQANSAAVRGAMGAGGGSILTVRRAIALLGLEGVRRAAQVMRPWPGAMDEAQAAELERQFELARRAGRIAQWLRPAGYDAELVYLLALLQRLGRLVVQYHFPEEAAQIRRLMQPAPSPKPGEHDEPGMSEEGAAFAVLGVDLEALAQAVAQLWGFDDAVQQMMRRLPLAAPVRHSTADSDLLRISASVGNELVDLLALPAHHRQAALLRVAQRYGRILDVNLADLQQAAQGIQPGSREAPAAAAAEAGAARPAAASGPGAGPGATNTAGQGS